MIDRVAVSIAAAAAVLVEDVFDGVLDAEAVVVLFDVVLVDVIVVDIVRPIQKEKQVCLPLSANAQSKNLIKV